MLQQPSIKEKAFEEGSSARAVFYAGAFVNADFNQTEMYKIILTIPNFLFGVGR